MTLDDLLPKSALSLQKLKNSEGQHTSVGIACRVIGTYIYETLIKVSRPKL